MNVYIGLIIIIAFLLICFMGIIKFYRFSSFNSENEIIKELKQNGYDAHYNQDDKKIIISYQNDIFEIKMEEKEKNLFRNHYNYIFSRQNN